jgi:circadian clock protein KaiB
MKIKAHAPAPGALARTRAASRRHVFHLYVSGNTARSIRTVELVKAFCEQHLEGRYELHVIDLFQQPGPARDARIIATPTLVRVQPEPVLRLLGELSNPRRLAASLGLRLKSD